MSDATVTCCPRKRCQTGSGSQSIPSRTNTCCTGYANRCTQCFCEGHMTALLSVSLSTFIASKLSFFLLPSEKSHQCTPSATESQEQNHQKKAKIRSMYTIYNPLVSGSSVATTLPTSIASSDPSGLHGTLATPFPTSPRILTGKKCFGNSTRLNFFSRRSLMTATSR